VEIQQNNIQMITLLIFHPILLVFKGPITMHDILKAHFLLYPIKTLAISCPIFQNQKIPNGSQLPKA